MRRNRAKEKSTFNIRGTVALLEKDLPSIVLLERSQPTHPRSEADSTDLILKTENSRLNAPRVITCFHHTHAQTDAPSLYLLLTALNRQNCAVQLILESKYQISWISDNI